MHCFSVLIHYFCLCLDFCERALIRGADYQTLDCTGDANGERTMNFVIDRRGPLFRNRCRVVPQGSKVSLPVLTQNMQKS